MRSFYIVFTITARAVAYTSRREKIQFFARLLVNSFQECQSLHTDEYEELLQTLDCLSYREISILKVLDSFSKWPREPDQNDLQWTHSFWEEFVVRLGEEVQVKREEIPSLLNRLTRTGCIEIFVGYWDAFGDIGKLTPTYSRLKHFISEFKA